jgi:hypothetical protein
MNWEHDCRLLQHDQFAGFEGIKPALDEKIFIADRANGSVTMKALI